MINNLLQKGAHAGIPCSSITEEALRDWMDFFHMASIVSGWQANKGTHGSNTYPPIHTPALRERPSSSPPVAEKGRVGAEACRTEQPASAGTE